MSCRHIDPIASRQSLSCRVGAQMKTESRKSRIPHEARPSSYASRSPSGEHPTVVRRSGIVAADGAHTALDSEAPLDVALSAPPAAAIRRASSRVPSSAASRPPSSLRKFDAKRVFQAARLCMMQGRTEDALLLVGQLCELHPEQAQYLALHAWLRVVRGELRAGHTGDAILSTLSRAVSERRDDMEIRMYRARALKRLGRAKEAYLDFCFVANVSPSNAEAVREVRAYDAEAAKRE